MAWQVGELETVFAALAVIVESIAATSGKCVMNTFEDHALCLTHYVTGETDSRTCRYMKALNDIELWFEHNAPTASLMHNAHSEVDQW